MKKKLALLLSAVMVMGTLPMSAFAVTTNQINKVVTGTEDTKYSKSEAPTLTIKEKNLEEEKEATFKLTLSNAEWNGLTAEDIEVYDKDGADLNNVASTAPDIDMKIKDETGAVVVFNEPTVGSAVTTEPANPEAVLVENGADAGEPVEFKHSDGYTYELVKDVVVDNTTTPATTTTTFYLYNQGTYFGYTAGSTTAIKTPDVNPTSSSVKVTKLAANQVIIEVKASVLLGKIVVPLMTELTDEGDATVAIDAMSSVLSTGTYKFANVVGGATNTTIEKGVDIQEGGSEIKSIVITETAAGSMQDGYFKLKLSNNFEFVESSVDSAKVTVHPSAQATVTLVKDTKDASVIYGKVDFLKGNESDEAITIAISGLKVKFDDEEVDAGDVAEITISSVSTVNGTKYTGSEVSKQTITVGTAKDYAVTWTAENKELPVFYSGRADDEVETLKVTLKEVIEASWLDNRKTEITFPEGVKVMAVDAKTVKNFNLDTPSINHKSETSVVTISGDRAGKSGKVELGFEFTLSISPEFTGDIVAKLTGSGVEDDMEAVIGTAVMPFTVEADTNEVIIDYRRVAITDIVVKEVADGLMIKDKELKLSIDKIDFDATPDVEIVEGDIKLADVKKSGGTVILKATTETQKTPATLKLSNVQLYLERSLPAGSYALKLSGDTFIQNGLVGQETAKGTHKFDVSSVTVLSDYIEIVTAGRDQDDSTFTTTIEVTIGADKLMAGKQEIALDVPAYISEGYTMLPVRAVTEALSGAAIVRWDDATKTVTITFGSRVISMTVGSKTMNINGVAVQMSKACEITDSRAFIPLRDLGYALGLNDSKITWDDATKTAKLN